MCRRKVEDDDVSNSHSNFKSPALVSNGKRVWAREVDKPMEMGLDALKRRTPVDEPIELGPTNTEDLYCELGPTNTEDLYRGRSGGSDRRDANKMRIGRKKGKLDATAREEEESSDGKMGERI